MKVNSINSYNNISFQRAFSTKEKEKYSKAMKDAREQLGLEETSVIVFGFNSPSGKGENYGLSSMNSRAFLPFINFVKENSSVSKIQAGPESNLDYYSNGKTYMPVTSPYSGTTFTLGIQTIALEKLTEEKYGSLLDENFIKSLDENYPKSKDIREYKTDYDYALGDNKNGAVFQGLRKAYQNFQEKIQRNEPSIKGLQIEFEAFKKNIPLEIKKEAYFDAIADEYHQMGKCGSDWKNWNFTDKFLFSDKVSENERQKRLDELSGSAEFYLFSQFLAQKQHSETKKELNEKGIKLFGDCLVCFSPKEVWANPSCFLENYYTGGIDPFCPETNNIQPWGSPALDYSKLLIDENKGVEKENLGATGKLLYQKFKTFMQNYDGVRMDAFWQYVTPFIYNDDLEGVNVKGVDNKILDIMNIASNDATGKKPNPNSFVLELIGFNTERGKELTKNIYPHVYSTAYAEYNENPRELIQNQGYKDGKFIIGATSHDNDSLVNMSRNKERRQAHIPILATTLNKALCAIGYNVKEYKEQTETSKKEEDFRTAKIAEIFTTKKQYFTLPDFFGMEERINISGKSDKNNWTVKAPIDYERFYYTQLSKGYGINFPKAYQLALISKGVNKGETLNLLSEAADILRSDGPMTTKEADELFG